MTKVTLRGDPDITYKDLKVYCPGQVTLNLQDVHISLELASSQHRVDDGRQWQYYGAIHFEARGNVLYIEGGELHPP